MSIGDQNQFKQMAQDEQTLRKMLQGQQNSMSQQNQLGGLSGYFDSAASTAVQIATAELNTALEETIKYNMALALTSSNKTIRTMAEKMERTRKRNEAIESAKEKLTVEEFELLGLSPNG